MRTDKSDARKSESQQATDQLSELLPQENMDKMSYSRLFSHSRLRGNIIRWYPVESGQRVLLVSEPCVALKEALRGMGAEVTAAPLDGTSAETAYKAMEKDDASDCFRGDTFGKVSGKYDIILQVGVFDTGEKNTQIAWKERLVQYRSLLKEKGILFLAVPNRFGLKYFAGCQDDYYDEYFAGPQGYTPEMTRASFGKKEYERLLMEAGFSTIETYYPYPDYRFPNAVYSDERLPEPGELTDNICNFDKDRYVLFDEAKVFGGLAEEGLFPALANSFLFVCHRKTPFLEGCDSTGQSGAGENGLENQSDQACREHMIYSKFSVERDEKFQIRTDIVQADRRVVRKYPLTKAAEKHVAHMESNYEKLKKQAEGTILQFCPVKMVQGAAEFPWVKGEALQHRLKRLLEQGDESAAEQLICQYVEVITALPGTEAVDVDLIFPNILVDGEVWNVIDYEWTFEAASSPAIPTKWVIYRAMFYLSIELPGYEMTKLPKLLKLAEITPEEEKKFVAGESRFQAYLKGSTLPIQNMVDLLGNQVIPFEGNENPKDQEAKRRMNLAEKDAKKLFFHLDRVEKSDGKGILAGWACAKTRNGAYIPVHITVFDREGNSVGRAVERMERADVAAVLKAETDFPYWGFHVSWSLAADRKFTLRLNAGKCQKEIVIFE